MAKILIIDDDPVARTALKSLLSTESPQVFDEAADGQSALDLLCDGLRPDLVMLDLQMPNMGGLELLQRIRRDSKLGHLKVIVSSGNRDREIILALAKLSISGYLLKPYDSIKTLAAVRQTLGTVFATHADTASRPDTQAKFILIVDDDDTARTALKDLVQQSLRADLLEARDGQEAYERLLNGSRPDLLIADLNMPTLDGIQLLQRIRGEPSLRTLPVIVASGTQDREKIRVLAQLHISGYLLKPYDAAKVRFTLRQALGLPHEAPPAVPA